MSVEYRPAKREAAPVLIGMAGPSGGGKTFSSLRLARGLADKQPFAMVDTENGRALHYADYFPEMQHAHLRAPFSPDAYIEAIKVADAAGFSVIVVDSISHEWEGDGGVLAMQRDEFKRLGSRESVRLTSWIEPKVAHKRLVAQLLQTKAHVILNMRAEDKVDMVKDADGKTVVVPKKTMTSILGYVPICERRLPFELTASFLLLPDAPGVPKPVKLQEQHRPFFPLDAPISEDAGRALAAWAAGSKDAPPAAALSGGAVSGGLSVQAFKEQRLQLGVEASEVTAVADALFPGRPIPELTDLERADVLAEAVSRSQVPA